MNNIIIHSKFADVFITIILIVVLIFLSYILIGRIIKERKRIIEESNLLIEGILTKSEMNSIITMYMNKMGDNCKFSLILLDMDKFEDLIQAFGKDRADDILKNAAKKIKEILPEGSFISNYQSDEFLIFLPLKFQRQEVLNYANDILKSFREKTEISGIEKIDLTTSVAIAFYPQHGRNVSNLLQSLKLAIYQVKKAGGNNIKIYNDDLSVDEQHLEYYYEVRNAISNKEFKFYYQPIYNVKNNSIYAYEALLRWKHPEHGTISPYKFINILEQSGDIHWVGQWGFETLVNKHKELRMIKSDYIPKLTLNLGPKQLMGENLVKDYAQIIRKEKIDASNFILEIGEFALFEKQQIIIENIKKLKKLGFRIAIDGFGIDLSTLEKLKELNLKIVKVDYSFIEEDSFAINKYMEILKEFTINDGMVIVQGIEEKNDENRIKIFEIEYAQGYYYSKPVTDEEVNVIHKHYIDKNNT